jgi:predicted transport protein
MMPIIFPKYDIGIVVKNCTNHLIEILEPWCSTLYTDADFQSYIKNQSSETTYDLNKRIFSINANVINNIEIRINGNKFDDMDYEIIKSISEIIREQSETGSFELGNMEVSIKNLESTEKTLTTITKKGN